MAIGSETMKKVHPYRHMRPRRIEIAFHDQLSYGVSRHGEDQDIRYGFGGSGDQDDESLNIVEIDLAWLGLVFHIVLTGEDQAYSDISKHRDDIERVKQLAQSVVLSYMIADSQRLLHILETIHDASREQGHLEVIKNTISAMNVKLDLSDKKL